MALALLSLPATLSAQTVKLPTEVKGEVGDFVAVSVLEGTDCPQIKWVAIDKGLKLFPSQFLKESRTTVVSSSKPGRYRLLAYGARQDLPSEPAIVTIVIEGETPTPQPDPKPNPKPDPKPDPKSQRVWLIVIEETADRSVERAKLFTDPELNARIKAKNHRYRIADKDVVDKDGVQPKDLVPYIERAKSKTGLPALFLVNDAGDLLFEGTLPADAKAVIELLGKVGG